METKPTRHFGLDILRVLACYMVVQIHTGEFFYIGDKGAVLNTFDAHVVAWYNSLFRICVPLFVMLSGYFLFPELLKLKGDEGAKYLIATHKKEITIIPFEDAFLDIDTIADHEQLISILADNK